MLIEAIRQSNVSYLLVQPATEAFYHRDLLLRELRARSDDDTPDPFTIVCREPVAMIDRNFAAAEAVGRVQSQKFDLRASRIPRRYLDLFRLQDFAVHE